MSKEIYRAQARVVGGRENGHGRTSDGALDVQLRPPGNDEGATNPEQLFAVGYAACFEGAIRVCARRQRFEIDDVTIDSSVALLSAEQRSFALAVEFDIALPEIDDPARAAEIVAAAHQICPYSRATRGNVEMSLRVNGQAVELDAA